MACHGSRHGCPDKLYHYTDNNGRCQIESSHYIKKSTGLGTTPDAMYGNGVYLTSIPPSRPTREILGNNWDGSGVDARRAEFYFEFDLANTSWDFKNNLEKVGDGSGRDIWVFRGRDICLPQGFRAKQRNINC